MNCSTCCLGCGGVDRTKKGNGVMLADLLRLRSDVEHAAALALCEGRDRTTCPGCGVQDSLILLGKSVWCDNPELPGGGFAAADRPSDCREGEPGPARSGYGCDEM